MLLKQKVSLYIQHEIIVALAWEIADKTVKVWCLDDYDFCGTVDLCEVTHHSSKLKTFIRDVLKNGKYSSKNPMHFDTVGFVCAEHI